MASERPSHSDDVLFEDDAFAASQSLEEELLGKGYFTRLGSSLAAELHSATNGDSNCLGPLSPSQSKTKLSSATTTVERFPPNAVQDQTCKEDNVRAESPSTELHKLIVRDSPKSETDSEVRLLRGMSPVFNSTDDVFSNQTSPVLSPLQAWSASMSPSVSGIYGRSSSRSTYYEAEDEDTLEVLKRQLEDIHSVVWETKTLHKRLLNTILSDEALQLGGAVSRNITQSTTSFAPPLELVVTSVINLVERNSRDRERQISYLRTVDSAIRKDGVWMTDEVVKDLDGLVHSMNKTLHDQAYLYENPLPALHKLNMETSSMAESLEELKEIMYVNKRQVQELNSRLRHIAKTVHDVRKDIRRMNKFLEDKDDDDTVVLEKGEAQERVKEIMWGLDDLDKQSSKQLKQIQRSWEEICG